MMKTEIIPHSNLNQANKKRIYPDVHRVFHRNGLPDYNFDEIILNHLSLDSANNLLDLGCGTGSFLLYANSIFPRLKSTGIDIDTSGFKYTLSKNTKSATSVSFELGDIQNLSQKSRFYDRITAIHMLSHVSDIQSALSEMSRVLSADGIVVVTTNSIRTKPLINTLIAAADRHLVNSVRHDHLERFSCENAGPLLRKYFNKVSYSLYHSLINISNPDMVSNYFEVMRKKWQPYPENHEWDGVMNIAQDCIEHRLRNGPILEPSIFGAYILSDPR